jgi:hypothetical protein
MEALLGPFLSSGANVVVTGHVPFEIVAAIARLDAARRVFVREPSRSRYARLAFELARERNPKVEARELAVGLRFGEPLSSQGLARVRVLVCDRYTANPAIESADDALEAVLVIDAEVDVDARGRAPALVVPEGFLRCDSRDGRVLLARKRDERAPWLGDAFATFAAQFDRRLGALPGPGSHPDNVCALRRHLQELFAGGGFDRLVDIGCSAGFLARDAWRAGVAYVGVDVVPAEIEAARRRHAHIPSATFVAADATLGIDVPPARTLVIVKEVLQHLGEASRNALLAQLDRFDDVLLVEDAPLADVEAPAEDGGYAPVAVSSTSRAGYAPAYTYYVDAIAKVVRGRSKSGNPRILLPPSSPAPTSNGTPAPVYEAGYFGFGDLWAIASEAVDRSMLERRPTRLARVRASGEDLGSRFEEILGVMDHGEGRVEIVDAPGTHDLNLDTVFSVRAWQAGMLWRRYRPTTTMWSLERAERRVALQLESRELVDGRYAGVKANPFNPWRLLPPELVEAARTVIADLGFDAVELGAHLSVRECVELAATSRLFIGMDSGMAHLCHSVRVPLAVYAYETPMGTSERSFHGGHPYEPFTDEPSLRAAIEKILQAT